MSQTNIKTIDLSNNEEANTYQIKVPKGMSPFLRTYEVSTVEFYKKQLEEILEKIPNINDTKLYLLAYIKTYGEDYKEHVLKSRICTSLESVSNFESSLRKMNLLHGYWPDAKLNPDIKLIDSDHLVLAVFKKVDTDEINHRNYQKCTLS